MSSEHSLFVRGLNGGLLCLTVNSTQTIASLKETLQDVAGIPAEEQLLGYRHSLADEASLLDNGISADAVISLSGRLRGGKGGFGSLLRGSGKGAVTENEDACRDLSGRRLRLVNAEKKLQEWAAADKQRKDAKKDAKQERDQIRAEEREAAAQVELDAVRKDQKVVMSRVAQAIESSLQAGNKRAGSTATQPKTKKPRYSSEDEDEDIDEDEGDGDEEGSEPVSGAAMGTGKQGSEKADAVEVPRAEPSRHQPPLQAVT